MTDILLTVSALSAFAAQSLDPFLLRSRSRLTFTLAIAAGILTKSVAGLLPVFAALLFRALSPHGTGLRLRRVAVLSTCAVVFASPWFLSHLTAHREWFFAGTGFQILTTNMRPHQTTAESHIPFHLSRLFYAAPLADTGVDSIPTTMGALHRRADMPLVLISNQLVLGFALMAFRFRSEQYPTPVVPLLALVAVNSSPLFERRFAPVVLAGIAVLFVVKASNPEQTCGMSYRSGTTIPAAGALSEHCDERRGNGLYILGVNEEFYALALPLARVHYGRIDPEGIVEDGRPHLFYLGILRHAGSPSHSSFYLGRLRAWGLDWSEPLGTAIVAHSAGRLAALGSRTSRERLSAFQRSCRETRPGYLTRDTPDHAGTGVALFENKAALRHAALVLCDVTGACRLLACGSVTLLFLRPRRTRAAVTVTRF